MSEMPFAVDSGGVAARFAELSQRHFFVADADLGVPTESPQDADSLGIAARHESNTRCAANGCGRMKVGEDPAFLCHLIEMGSFVGGGAKGADIGVTHVVDEDDDDIGRVSR